MASLYQMQLNPTILPFPVMGSENSSKALPSWFLPVVFASVQTYRPGTDLPTRATPCCAAANDLSFQDEAPPSPPPQMWRKLTYLDLGHSLAQTVSRGLALELSVCCSYKMCPIALMLDERAVPYFWSRANNDWSLTTSPAPSISLTAYWSCARCGNGILPVFEWGLVRWVLAKRSSQCRKTNETNVLRSTTCTSKVLWIQVHGFWRLGSEQLYI